jgi:hypothetical protein
MFGFHVLWSLLERFYNSRYDEICEAVYPKDLLKLPDSISGYYLDHNCNEIAITDERQQDDRFGIETFLLL